MIEYALLVALVSFVCVVAMRRVGTAAKQDLNDVRIEIANAGNDGQTP
jgi:Flp pilus assembly pilin Flp